MIIPRFIVEKKPFVLDNSDHGTYFTTHLPFPLLTGNQDISSPKLVSLPPAIYQYNVTYPCLYYDSLESPQVGLRFNIKKCIKLLWNFFFFWILNIILPNCFMYTCNFLLIKLLSKRCFKQHQYA